MAVEFVADFELLMPAGDARAGQGGGQDKAVFSTSLQAAKDLIEVFSAQGKDPTTWWEFKGAADRERHAEESAAGGARVRKLGVSRKYDAASRGLFIKVTDRAILPKPPRRLNLVHPYLVFQCFVPEHSSGFRCTLVITDDKGEEKALSFSSMLHNALVNSPIRKCLPLQLQSDVWVNLVIDMQDLVPVFFQGAKFASLDRIELEAACRLRRIFTTAFKPNETHFIPAQTPGAPVLLSRTRNEAGAWSASKQSALSSPPAQAPCDADPAHTLPSSLLLPSTCAASTVVVDAHQASPPASENGTSAPPSTREPSSVKHRGAPRPRVRDAWMDYSVPRDDDSLLGPRDFTGRGTLDEEEADAILARERLAMQVCVRPRVSRLTRTNTHTRIRTPEYTHTHTHTHTVRFRQRVRLFADARGAV